ncbi:MAG: response regulator [Nitrospira sp.]|nr:response regulator [Nitrospira sp.]
MQHATADIARLFATQAGEVRQYLKQLAMLNESGQNIQEGKASLPALLQGILRTAKVLTGARYAALGVFDETGERLVQFLTEGIDEETKRAIGAWPTGRGLLGALIKDERTLRLKDVSQHKASVGFPPHHPVMRSFLGTAIRAHGKVFGRLYLTDKVRPGLDESMTDVSVSRAAEFTDVDEQLIMALAFQAGMAIETASLIEEIKVAQRRDRAVLDSVQEGILGIDLTGACMFANRACVEALGYAQDELIGRNVHALIHHTREDGTSFPEAECPIMQALHSQRECHLENEILWRKDGTSFPVMCTVATFRDEWERVAGAVVSFVDCTERRALEIQRRQGQRMELLGYLAAGVAHDFNNLLTIMQGYGELVLLHADLPTPARTKIQEIKKAVDRAMVLTGQLLAFARKQPVERQVVDINDLVRGIEPFFRQLLTENIVLCFDLTEKRLPAKVDGGGIEQALLNLVVNARDAMPTGGRLEICTAIHDQAGEEEKRTRKRIGQSVVIRVSDSGVGMDQTTLDHIFEPFFTTKSTGRGTGLGLATVYRIVTENDGTIQVASKVGVGTTFTLLLPLAEQEEQIPPSVFHVPVQGGGETVLLVEDDPAVQEIVKTMLENEGYHVLTASDGSEGIHVALSYNGVIHLLIADVMMPNTDGVLMVRSLRSRMPNLKVLFITGGTATGTVMGGELSATGEVLSKPFTNGALLAAVRRVLDQPVGHLSQNRVSRMPKRVLVLDDDGQVNSLVQEILRSERYEVLTAISGVEGLELLRQQSIDLLITDILLPGMDGIEVIQEVRRVRPALKILAVSGGGIGATPEFLLNRARQAGAAGTLAKPFTREQLLAVVRQMVD